MDTVQLEQGITDPLGTVAERASGDGPLNVVGLELAIPDADQGRPALLALNLERAEWSERLHRPVILWIPEFLLEILGREAADFLDWRSDTVHFPQERLSGLEAMDSALWEGERAQAMPARAREERIEELRSRLATTRGSDDAVAQEARASWLRELGDHLAFFGRLQEAEETYREAVAIAEEIGYLGPLAAGYFELGRLAMSRSEHLEANRWFQRALEIFESLEHRVAIARVYDQLGKVALHLGDLSSAQGWYRRSLEILEFLGDHPRMARSYHQLGMVAQSGGNLSSAEGWYRRALELDESLGNRPGMAQSYHQLGVVAQSGGDLSSAEGWYRRSLELEEALGNRPGMAQSFHQLGMVAQERGDLSSAEDWYRRSLEIEESLGSRPGMALSYGQLGLLAEARDRKEEALEWTVRCVALFEEFPHPSTGPGPKHLARLAGELGMGALESAWERVTGRALPATVRSWVEERL